MVDRKLVLKITFVPTTWMEVLSGVKNNVTAAALIATNANPSITTHFAAFIVKPIFTVESRNSKTEVGSQIYA